MIAGSQYQSVSQKGRGNAPTTNVVIDRLRWNGDEEETLREDAGDENGE